MMTVSMDPRLHVLIVGSRVPAGTLTQAAAYTAFNEYDHVSVGKQFKIYASMF